MVSYATYFFLLYNVLFYMLLLLLPSIIVILTDLTHFLKHILYVYRIQLDPNEEEQVVLCNILGGVYFEKIESC